MLSRDAGRPRVRRRRARALRCVLAVLLSLVATTALAAGIEFSASVDRTTVGLGEQFQLVLAVQGEDMAAVPQPTLPALPDFSVLGSSSSQSTNISIMNGQMKKQVTVNFVYALVARKLGALTIPACKLVYQGQEYQSQPIQMTVVKASQGQAHRRRRSKCRSTATCTSRWCRTAARSTSANR